MTPKGIVRVDLDEGGTGTNVAGIITSKGTVAPLGGAPDAEIVAVKRAYLNNGYQ